MSMEHEGGMCMEEHVPCDERGVRRGQHQGGESVIHSFATCACCGGQGQAPCVIRAMPKRSGDMFPELSLSREMEPLLGPLRNT